MITSQQWDALGFIHHLWPQHLLNRTLAVAPSNIHEGWVVMIQPHNQVPFVIGKFHSQNKATEAAVTLRMLLS